jgi:hypothetical protein
VAVGDEIDALATRVKDDLDDLLDFSEHIDLVWKQFTIWVDQGNILRSRNAKTKTEVTERDLIGLYSRYRTTYLQGLGFVQIATVF